MSLIGTILAFTKLPPEVRIIAEIVAQLAPEVRQGVLASVKAVRNGDDEGARRAFEAALRVQFMARQR